MEHIEVVSSDQALTEPDQFCDRDRSQERPDTQPDQPFPADQRSFRNAGRGNFSLTRPSRCIGMLRSGPERNKTAINFVTIHSAGTVPLRNVLLRKSFITVNYSFIVLLIIAAHHKADAIALTAVHQIHSANKSECYII